ncbi:hypothetical protein AB0G04_24350 [Actinoplanes sp. NPDC023801]|uniref:DUF6197 family protein n=1 Tax=Actinoplanes sp. NPDC023801 TaxID=3154595 RepID=UPI0033DE33CB
MTLPKCDHQTVPPRTCLDIGDVADLLDRAAAYLVQNGWTPAALYDTHSGCRANCWVHRTHRYSASALGAIRAAMFGRAVFYLDHTSDEALHVYTAAVEWFNSYLLTVGHARRHASLFDWETAPNRTRVHVIGALQYAASAYRLHSRRTAA